MVRLQSEGTGPVHGFRLSTVSASWPTEMGTTHEPTGLDLAMKLHYLKVVYIYSPETARALTVMDVKGPLFQVFDLVPWVTGRFRRHDSGRPYIKCNDCGTRFVESQCDLTLEEWLDVPDRSIDESLVYHQPVGPELTFSPLIYIQMTRFKCGGLALGLSWAHIMGDPFSVSHFFNLWTRALAGEKIYIPKTSDLERVFQNPHSTGKEPDSLKRVDPVGDLWVTPSNSSKMATYSFSVTVDDIKLHSPANGDEFKILSGMIWKCIAKARGDSEPVTITIIRSDPNGLKPRAVRNSQMISSVQVDFSVAEANLEEILKSIGEATDERSAIDAVGESHDFVFYGAKLTFVDLSEVDFYEAKVMNKPPKSVYCNVQGVGNDGAVVVLPAVKKEERVVTVTLPEEEMDKVKRELKNCGLINHGVN